MLKKGALAAALLVAAACGGTTVDQITGPDPVRCQIALGSSSASVPASGTQLDLTVTANRDCTWSSRADAAWITVSPTSGQGDGAVAVTVLPNNAPATRSATVDVNDSTFRVSQAAAIPLPPPCTYRLSPTSRSIGESGGTRTVQVDTRSTCPWTATTNVGWITFVSPASGTGTTTILYRVDRHNGRNDRLGVITIAGETHTVFQEGD